MNTVVIRGKKINHISRHDFFNKASYGYWEPDTFSVLDRYLVTGETFIDIGAWCGIFSIYAAKLGSKVLAVEPDRVAYVELINNVLENASVIDQIVCMRVAVSDSNGYANLNTETYNGFGNSESSLIQRVSVAAIDRVSTIDLEQLYKKASTKVCLIKIDTEGSEVLIIKNSFEFLKEYKPIIWISFHPAWFPDYQKDVDMFVETLFPIYNFYGMFPIQNNTDGNGILCDEYLFRDSMYPNQCHNFLLIPKS